MGDELLLNVNNDMTPARIFNTSSFAMKGIHH